MKLRAGFVANSSTSSYLIIGVEYDSYIKKFAEMQGLFFRDFDNNNPDKELENARLICGIYEKDDILYIGNGYELSLVGMDAEPILETMNIQQAKQEFREKATSLGIDVPINIIKLYYGEVEN